MYRFTRSPRAAIAGVAALALLLAAVSAESAAAEDLTLRFDPAATEVSFQVGATGHDVHGHLALRSGELSFDPASGAVTGEIAVDATSADTGNGSRDKTMRQEVLETERFPLLVFRPDRFTGELALEGSSEVELHGELDIHGATHAMTLPARVEIAGGHLTARTTFPVPYVEWGLENPGFLFLKVAPVVEVTVAAEGDLVPSTAAAAASRAGSGRGADGR